VLGGTEKESRLRGPTDYPRRVGPWRTPMPPVHAECVGCRRTEVHSSVGAERVVARDPQLSAVSHDAQHPLHRRHLVPTAACRLEEGCCGALSLRSSQLASRNHPRSSCTRRPVATSARLTPVVRSAVSYRAKRRSDGQIHRIIQALARAKRSRASAAQWAVADRASSSVLPTAILASRCRRTRAVARLQRRSTSAY